MFHKNVETTGFTALTNLYFVIYICNHFLEFHFFHIKGSFTVDHHQKKGHIKSIDLMLKNNKIWNHPKGGEYFILTVDSEALTGLLWNS